MADNFYNYNGIKIAKTPGTENIMSQRGYADVPQEPLYTPEIPAVAPVVAPVAPVVDPIAPEIPAVEPINVMANEPQNLIADTGITPQEIKKASMEGNTLPEDTTPTKYTPDQFAAPPVTEKEVKTGVDQLQKATSLDKSYEDLKASQIKNAVLNERAATEASALYNANQTQLNKIQADALEAQERTKLEIEDAQKKYQDATADIDNYLKEKPEQITMMSGVENKALAYIGVILSGIGAGMTGSNQNAAFNVLKGRMDASIAQQKQNYQQKLSGMKSKAGAAKDLYGFMMDKFKNEQQATDATRRYMLDATQNQIQALSLKYKNPQIQANLQQSLAKLDVEKAKLDQDYQKALLAQNIKSQGRKVEGIGMTKTAKQADELNKSKISAGESQKIINRLKEINKIPFNSMRPEVIAEANQLVGKLKAESRIAISGGGNVSEYEQKLLKEFSPNPTDFFTLESSTDKKLNTLEKMLHESVQQRAKQYVAQWESPQIQKYYSAPGLKSHKERQQLAGITQVPTFKPKK